MLSVNDLQDPIFKTDFQPEPGKYHVAFTKEVLTQVNDGRNFTLIKTFDDDTPVEEWQSCVSELFKSFDIFGVLLITPEGENHLYCPKPPKNTNLN